MGYVGSYVWQLRQKVGDKKLLTTTVDVLPVDEAGRVKLIYAKAFDRWSTVGGHVEEAIVMPVRHYMSCMKKQESLRTPATLSSLQRSLAQDGCIIILMVTRKPLPWCFALSNGKVRHRTLILRK